jgi:predicted O-methyltransferase YrrM
MKVFSFQHYLIAGPMDDLQELKSKIEKKLDKQYPSGIFLDRLRVIDEESRKTNSYTDPRYIPFYYWLGTLVCPENFVEVGFRLGLCSACFLKGCKTVKKFVGFQQRIEEFYSPNLGRRNVRDHYKNDMWLHVGGIHDEETRRLLTMTNWDMVIIDEFNYDTYRSILDVCWSHMSLNGIIAMDYINNHKPSWDAYHDFCKGNNRTSIVVNTRYGVGLVKK